MNEVASRVDGLARTFAVGVLLFVASVLSACNKAPIVRDFDNFCDVTLQDKTVQVDGYIAVDNITICGEDAWGRARCPLAFVDRADGLTIGPDHSIWVYLDDGANRMHMPQNSDLDKLTVFGNDGKRLDPLRPVRVIGELSGPDEFSKSCSMDLASFEQINAIKPKQTEVAPDAIVEYKPPVEPATSK
jgi:hypothetical protein